QHPHAFHYLDEGVPVDETGCAIELETTTLRHRSEHIRINHYYTRSEAEFVTKLLRGNADQLAKRSLHLASPTYYQRLSQVRDERMLAYLPALRERLAIAP